ncbi:undecaprenyl-diphosphate phosphatase [Desulfococcus sp.]|uniref:undecaprenyl-diphosphate phosphatase n=1 Tax=Desulfococcus sp. TaxID=2025834 RepID=UPI003593658A
METIHAIALGAIQGLTEFLPVSSSGHLVLFQQLFGLKEAELFFDISVHMGTLGAVIIFFRKEISSLLLSLFQAMKRLMRHEITPAEVWADAEVKLALLIVLGSLPTAVIGLLFHQISDQLFSSVFLVGITLIVTGVLLWGTRRIYHHGRGISGFTAPNAVAIGVVQGLAILPGISRSGSTIAAGLYLGLEKGMVARFSFLLSIPAIIGAQILSLREMGSSLLPDPATLMGTITAFIVGYLSLAMLMHVVNRGRMYLFAPYCWMVGGIALAVGW